GAHAADHREPAAGDEPRILDRQRREAAAVQGNAWGSRTELLKVRSLIGQGNRLARALGDDLLDTGSAQVLPHAPAERWRDRRQNVVPILTQFLGSLARRDRRIDGRTLDRAPTEQCPVQAAVDEGDIVEYALLD